MTDKEPALLWIADQGDGTYTNPILYTDYSDPDVIRVENDYFMVASSFCNAPAVPVLHSRDLVNWKVINYVMEQLPFSSYEKPRHGCGTWAPAIRYHDGLFYVFVPFPDESILMCSTPNPWEKWSEPSFVKRAAGWIDPCPFWDDDGKAYMVNAFAKSRVGFNSVLFLSEMDPSCSEILTEGTLIYDGHETQPTIEGPKLYKRNGWYYIFAPAGGVQTGWQTVLRSRNIWGPYEEKIVMRQGASPVNGPHQGGYVETQTGESWFIHFQDVGNAGRITHLQPMYWENDWPVIGEDKDHTGCGVPVLRYRKPNVGAVYPTQSPAASDYFEQKQLGLQWQWNANYRKEWYTFTENGLRLSCIPQTSKVMLCDLPNLLLQKWPAPEFQINTCIQLTELKEGDVCGLISLGGLYSALCVARTAVGLELQMRTGERGTDAEQVNDLLILHAETQKIYLRMTVEKESLISFYYSLDGHSYSPATEQLPTSPGRWVGVKAGLFAIHESVEKPEAIQNSESAGFTEISWFLFEALPSIKAESDL